MSDPPDQPPRSDRRDFLTGRAVRRELEQRGEELADQLSPSQRARPETGDTVRLATTAMNCEFSIILNPSRERRALIAASDALERVHEVETRLTVYRDTSELLELNRNAALGSTAVDQELLALLREAIEIARQTGGAFNPLARSLNALWRECRQAGRIPEHDELQNALQQSDWSAVQIDESAGTVTLPESGMGFDLGGMGKGYALDVIARFLEQEQVQTFLVHGGHSSVLARGDHVSRGWPVGIRHPLQPQKRLATLVLRNTAFSASGSGVQYFRHQGKRYGHIFDPRTGWPVEHLLSVAVTAPTAARADALSTAFSVMSIEQTRAYCGDHPEVAAILIPPSQGSLRVNPILLNIDPEDLFWE